MEEPRYKAASMAQLAEWIRTGKKKSRFVEGTGCVKYRRRGSPTLLEARDVVYLAMLGKLGSFKAIHAEWLRLERERARLKNRMARRRGFAAVILGTSDKLVADMAALNYPRTKVVHYTALQIADLLESGDFEKAAAEEQAACRTPPLT